MPKYRLLQGMAILAHPTERHDDNRTKDMVIRAPAIIDTEVDLVALFNSNGSRKFERLHEVATESPMTWDPAKETIEQFALRMKGLTIPQVQTRAWSMEDLEKVAADEEISVDEAARLVGAHS